MTPPDQRECHRLFNAALNDQLSDTDKRQLASVLKSSAEARQLWFLYHDNECSLAEMKRPDQINTRRTGLSWLSWRPLTAAAAGLVIGLFSASVVFGIVVQRGVEKRMPIGVFEPGFENPQMSLSMGFTGRPGRWSGDAARVVAAENGVSPKEGKFMLRMEPLSKGVPRIYQVLDLQSLPPGAGGESREIEVSASFAAADAEASVRYVIRAVAGTEGPENLDATWFDRREEAIALVTRGMDVMPGTKGWQTFSVKIQVPRAARSLVLFFGVRTPDKAVRTSPHYLDDVRVSLLTPPPLP